MEKVEIDNIIRISSRNDISNYSHSVIMRMQPRLYNKYGCIKLRFTKDHTRDVQYLCMMFWHAGLTIQSWEKLPEGLRLGRGVILEQAYEVTLIKTGATLFEDDNEFYEWLRKVKNY
jgi:hypothetical protein